MENINIGKENGRFTDTPTIRGPFRSLIIMLPKNNDFTEFKELYPLLTVEHPNFHFCKFDKHKCIVYYKYPYNVATLLSKYQDNMNLNLFLYYDELTKNLQSDVLYIVTKSIDNLLRKIEQLNGTIIYKTSLGFQVKFEDFKMTAIAHEELRKEFKVKFAYKREVSKHSNPTKISKDDEEKYQLKSDIDLLIKKYRRCPTDLEMQDKFEEIRKRQKEINHRRIIKAAENLDLANVSWNIQCQIADNEETFPDHDGSENKTENILDELQKLLRKL